MNPIVIGALIAGAAALLVGIVANYGMSDTVVSVLFCWAPLGALIGWAWGTKVQVSRKKLEQFKRESASKDPTRYDPNE